MNAILLFNRITLVLVSDEDLNFRVFLERRPNFWIFFSAAFSGRASGCQNVNDTIQFCVCIFYFISYGGNIIGMIDLTKSGL